MLVVKAGRHKILIRIANKEGPDQTASSESGTALFGQPFLRETSVLNFRTSTARFIQKFEVSNF